MVEGEVACKCVAQNGRRAPARLCLVLVSRFGIRINLRVSLSGAALVCLAREAARCHYTRLFHLLFDHRRARKYSWRGTRIQRCVVALL